MFADIQHGNAHGRTSRGTQGEPHRHIRTPRLVAEIGMSLEKLFPRHGPMAGRSVVSLVERLHGEEYST